MNFSEKPIQWPLKITLAWGVITAVISILAYYYWDRSIFLYLNKIYFLPPLSLLDEVNFFLSKIFTPGLWLAVTVLTTIYSIYMYWIAAKLHVGKHHWVKVSLSLIYAIVLLAIIKIVFDRYAPSDLIHHEQYGFQFLTFNNSENFPSIPTTLTFAGLLSIASCFQSKAWIVFALIIATLSSFSHIYLGTYFFSDTIMGVYIGVMSYYWARSMSSYLTQLTSRPKLD